MKTLIALVLIFLTLFSWSQPLWMRYPSISPDGSQIAFSYKGDIYLVASDGGKAMPITLANSYEGMPIWSKDGQSIAYVSDRYGNLDIFIQNLGTNEVKRLTYHSSDDYPCTFSPDNQAVLFNSWRVDIPKYAQFPNSRMPELYQISVQGGTPKVVLTTPSESVSVNHSNRKIYYQDRKGYEDPFRKHQVSSIARDIWLYDKATNTHIQLTDYVGEDRNPVLSPDEDQLYYLSEESGSFNVHMLDLANTSLRKQVTSMTKYPIRSLSISDQEVLCYEYNGEIYTVTNNEPKKVNVEIQSVRENLERETVPISDGISEMSLSPNGKEFVFIKRGEVFVASVEEGTTKRITNTGSQERSVSFSPDGKSLIYAGERNGSWNIYQTAIENKDEEYFFNATILNESALVATEAQEFQPVYAPDGKKVAYLEDRTILKVIDLSSMESKIVLPANRNYSYADGDIFFSWSPDSRWIASDMLMPNQWISQIGLINTETNEVMNITKSGYDDSYPKWTENGHMIYWFTNRDGMKNHGSWGSERDVYGFLLNDKAYSLFQLSKEEFELMKEEKQDEEEVRNKEGKNQKDEKEEVEPIIIQFDDIKKRRVRLTIHSSRLNDAIVSNDGEKLYYLARFEKGADLWSTNLRTKKTELLTKLGVRTGSLMLDEKGENIFVVADGHVFKINTENGEKKQLKFIGEMELKKQAEYEYMFEHMWQQVKDKFYVEGLHGVNWIELRDNYKKFLPHITNNRDFSELMSELLGELNASHTGCRYYPENAGDDQTGSLGLIFDENYSGKGFKIAEILKDGPCDKADVTISAGDILIKINGEELSTKVNLYNLLNRSIDKKTRLSLLSGEEAVIKPISRDDEYNLLYERWVANRKKEVEEASGGKVGYVHVRGMNNASFRSVFEEVLGENYEKESLIVDTRSNGGGWLHDDLATFLNGKAYIEFLPRGQKLGGEPRFKWKKPSVVLVGESNYSDAHMFPYTYSALNIGSTVGMPVPGTATAVWWERQIDPTIVFGIPQVGMVDLDGDFLENKQFIPDYKIKNTYEKLTEGVDEQLRKAVEVLLEQKNTKPEDPSDQTLENK